MNEQDIRQHLGLRPIINVSGTMTSLGASIAPPEVVEAVAAILPQFVEIDDLQKRASRVIARLCGTEAGFVTASCSAAITLAVAGAMTGSDLAAIERLPDTTSLKNEVLIQAGHMVSYGAPVEQGIRLAGARVVPVGQATSARKYQLRGAITERTAAALYVVSHHTVQYGLIPLDEFVEVCHARGVPVMVDAASEYDLKGFLAVGADLALYSSHKFLGGPTGGIVAGRTELVRATYLQNSGIGRGMKIGKEGMVGTIAALEAWEKRDHEGIRARERGYLELWQKTLAEPPRHHARRSSPIRPAIRSTVSRSRSSRRRLTSRPGISPTRWRAASRRSSCATMRSSTASSTWTHATCIPARSRSWHAASPTNSIAPAAPTRSSPPRWSAGATGGPRPSCAGPPDRRFPAERRVFEIGVLPIPRGSPHASRREAM